MQPTHKSSKRDTSWVPVHIGVEGDADLVVVAHLVAERAEGEHHRPRVAFDRVRRAAVSGVAQPGALHSDAILTRAADTGHDPTRGGGHPCEHVVLRNGEASRDVHAVGEIGRKRRRPLSTHGKQV